MPDIHFLSGNVPESASEYARFYFSQFTLEQLLDLGFTYEEVEHLRLAPAITAYEYDECDSLYYYFPVLSENRIIAMLTMIDMGNDKYSVQFGKSNFAESLNEISNNSLNPNILVITDDAMYSLDQSNNFVIVDSYDLATKSSKSV